MPNENLQITFEITGSEQKQPNTVRLCFEITEPDQ